MKLRYKVVIIYTCVTLFIMAISGVVLYSIFWNERFNVVRTDISNQLYHIDYFLDSFFTEAQSDIEALSQNELVRLRDDSSFTNFSNIDVNTFKYNIKGIEQNIIELFSTYKETRKYVNSVYMGRENGSFVRSHKWDGIIVYDPRIRPWYKLAKLYPDRVVMTDPYRSLTMNDINIGIEKALIDEKGIFYGVVGADITLVNFTDYLSKYKTNPDGKILIIDKKGIILAGLEDYMLFKNVEDYSPGLWNIISSIDQGWGEIRIGNEKNYVFFLNSSKYYWKITVLVPAKSIENQIKSQLAVTISGLMICLILLSFLTLSGLDIFIIRPLKKIKNETDYIARTSDLEKHIDIHSKDEIGELTSSFNKMMDSLNTLKKSLHISERKYRDIFENAVMGIFQSTSSGVFLNVNPTLAFIFGYSTPEELINDVKDLQEEFYVNPEDRVILKRIYEKSQTVKGFQAELKRRDGSHFWVSISGKAICDDEGNILYYEGTIEDITLNKMIESELAKHQMHLETLVKERTAELEIAKDRAEESDRLKSAFLATMSHELRTPLNSIIGFTGIILMEMAGTLNDEQKKQLNMVKNSAQHLLSLINDVLDISKIEAGQLNMVYEECDIGKSIKKVVDTAIPLASRKGLEVIVDVQKNIGMITYDSRRVEQVLLNLLSNAIKFSDKGAIRICCESNKDDIVFRVVDTGIGIKEEDINTIFKPFRQIDSGLTRKYEGTGLGLSICKKLVELMGGNIGVESVLGEGSTFYFSIPRRRGDV